MSRVLHGFFRSKAFPSRKFKCVLCPNIGFVPHQLKHHIMDDRVDLQCGACSLIKFKCVPCPNMGFVTPQLKHHFDDDRVDFQYGKRSLAYAIRISLMFFALSWG